MNCENTVLMLYVSCPSRSFGDGLRFDEGFRADLIVESKVLVELKSKEKVITVDKKRVLTHLRLLKLKPGLLINFGEELIKNGISRIVNGLPDD